MMSPLLLIWVVFWNNMFGIVEKVWLPLWVISGFMRSHVCWCCILLTSFEACL